MKHKPFFILSGLLSATIFLTFRWIGESYDIISRLPLEMTQVTTIILHDGKYEYHLNPSSFELEFPHLQKYQCSMTLSPPVARYNDSDLPLILMAIKSHPGDGNRRSAIRQTWGKEQELKGYKMRRLFLVGRTEMSGQMEIMKVESAMYGDILQWDMTEGHHNLSLKERCFLDWLHHNVPEVHYIFKGDDDVFVNIELVVDLIKDFGSPNVIHGFHQHRPPVMRYTKYSISKTLYPLAYYPGFVSGGGFIFSGPSVPSLYEASCILPVFPLDDVYFGFLALAANLTYRHDPRFYVWGLKYDTCGYKKALLVHGISPDRLPVIWQEVNENKCEKTEQQNNFHNFYYFAVFFSPFATLFSAHLY